MRFVLKLGVVGMLGLCLLVGMVIGIARHGGDGSHSRQSFCTGAVDQRPGFCTDIPDGSRP